MLVADAPETDFADEVVAIATGDDVTDLLEYESDNSRFRLVHSRKWHVISESPKKAILRMIDSGDTIAQLNIHDLPISNEKKVSLDHFKAEVQKLLQKSEPQIVDATETSNENGFRVMRVCVVGKVSDAPVQWIYYHLGNESGQAVSCVFTMSADRAEKFGAADIEITSGLRLKTPDSESQTGSASKSILVR